MLNYILFQDMIGENVDTNFLGHSTGSTNMKIDHVCSILIYA